MIEEALREADDQYLELLRRVGASQMQRHRIAGHANGLNFWHAFTIDVDDEIRRRHALIDFMRADVEDGGDAKGELLS